MTDVSLDTKTNEKLAKPKRYQVVILNDDFTSMDFVVFLLQKVFKKTSDEANALMMEVHKSGRGIAGSGYTHEIAETKVLVAEQMAKQDESPLKLATEPME